jgi:hypothetical protein
MTIRVEREALLMVINTSSSSSFSSTSPLSSTSSSSWSPCIRDDDDEFVIVDSVPTIKGKNNCFYSDYLTSSYARDNDDQASLCTISTTSDSSFDSTSDISTIADHRRVSFAPQLVTDVWTRERTRLEDISNLYYSAQQTQTVGTTKVSFFKKNIIIIIIVVNSLFNVNHVSHPLISSLSHTHFQ